MVRLAVAAGEGCLEECESGRIGTLGKRVWGNSPWVRIPPPPPKSVSSPVVSPTAADSPASNVVSVPALLDLHALMGVALDEARAAAANGDVPVGAVVVIGGEIVAARHNERELTGDPTAHAEVLALRDAAAKVGSWRLADATLIVTLEPCPMCAGAALNARIGHVVYGAGDPKAGATGSLYNLCADARLNHEIAVTPFVRADESSALLQQFFAALR